MDWYSSNLKREIIGADEAKAWCLSGLVMMYGFNHEESVACFKRAIEKDFNCAFAYWGVSHSLGINYNETTISDVCQ